MECQNGKTVINLQLHLENLDQFTVDQDQDLFLPAYVIKHDGSKHVLQQIQMSLSMTLLSNKLTFLNLSQLMQ